MGTPPEQYLYSLPSTVEVPYHLMADGASGLLMYAMYVYLYLGELIISTVFSLELIVCQPMEMLRIRSERTT